MTEPFAGMQPRKSALDVQDLTAHEELCRDLEEEHDREEEQASKDGKDYADFGFWPEED